MPDGTIELIDPHLTAEQLADRHRLNRVRIAPAIDFCAVVYLDGPLAGRMGYAVNELGHQSQVTLASGQTCDYEVTRLAAGDQPAEARVAG